MMRLEACFAYQVFVCLKVEAGLMKFLDSRFLYIGFG